MEKLIAKKSWSNAVAFIKADENGRVSVRAKFSDGRRWHEGPEVRDIAVVPENLKDEVNALTTRTEEMSCELKEFCLNIWTKVRETNSWFCF